MCGSKTVVVGHTLADDGQRVLTVSDELDATLSSPKVEYLDSSTDVVANYKIYYPTDMAPVIREYRAGGVIEGSLFLSAMHEITGIGHFSGGISATEGYKASNFMERKINWVNYGLCSEAVCSEETSTYK